MWPRLALIGSALDRAQPDSSWASRPDAYFLSSAGSSGLALWRIGAGFWVARRFSRVGCGTVFMVWAAGLDSLVFKGGYALHNRTHERI